MQDQPIQIFIIPITDNGHLTSLQQRIAQQQVIIDEFLNLLVGIIIN